MLAVWVLYLIKKQQKTAAKIAPNLPLFGMIVRILQNQKPFTIPQDTDATSRRVPETSYFRGCKCKQFQDSEVRW
jgi:hypothetical protein